MGYKCQKTVGILCSSIMQNSVSRKKKGLPENFMLPIRWDPFFFAASVMNVITVFFSCNVFWLTYFAWFIFPTPCQAPTATVKSLHIPFLKHSCRRSLKTDNIWESLPRNMSQHLVEITAVLKNNTCFFLHILDYGWRNFVDLFEIVLENQVPKVSHKFVKLSGISNLRPININ